MKPRKSIVDYFNTLLREAGCESQWEQDTDKESNSYGHMTPTETSGDVKDSTKVRVLRNALRNCICFLEFWSNGKATFLPKAKKVLEQTKQTKPH